jgi:hypothetical protein
MNTYIKEIKEQQEGGKLPNCNLLANSANYLIKMLNILGVDPGMREFDFFAQQQR